MKIISRLFLFLLFVGSATVLNAQSKEKNPFTNQRTKKNKGYSTMNKRWDPEKQKFVYEKAKWTKRNESARYDPKSFSKPKLKGVKKSNTKIQSGGKKERQNNNQKQKGGKVSGGGQLE